MTAQTQTGSRSQARMADEPGVRFGIATGAEILTLVVAGLVGLGTTVTGIALVTAAALSGRMLPGWARLALGVVGWAFFTGFVENRYGLLTFATGDLVRLGLIVASTYLLAQAVTGGGTAD